ncbi:hypothetical protein [Ferrimonas pelagia]|uniref:hypothetical protein n=1 Tax=Ferrimonas pelagia TaxID=1177826 RepID=UPI0031ED0F7B
MSYNAETGQIALNGQAPEVCNEYVIMGAGDFLTLSVGRAFDTEVFTTAAGLLLLSFVTGHFAGRLVRWLGK